MDSDPADPSPFAEATVAAQSTGQPEMDRQHQRLLLVLQRMDESLRGPFPLATLGARLKQLEELGQEHFREEEAMLEAAGYPHLKFHRAEHARMEERFHELIAEFASPDSPPLTALCEAFLALFVHHVETVDLDYAGFLRQQVAEPASRPD
jgi:hemerythrin-like metal-binding protein